MRRVSKKVSVFFAMFFLMISFMPKMIFADNADDKTIIYVHVPEDWKNPCVWAWDDDGNNAFEAWPGEEAEADTANEDWYYIWIPSSTKHVIVNANEGSIQTEEQILDGNNAWITVTAADSTEVSEGEIPEYTEKFKVHAKVDESWKSPCLWAWSAPDGTNAFEAWPGNSMKEEENGWYSCKVPTWVNSIIVNANEGGVQTEDISIDASEVWVTVDAQGAAEFSYVDPEKEEIPNITVHVIAPDDWQAPCLWAWSAPDGTNVFTTWPGEPLEEGENGWLIKEIPGWVNSVIVNGNEGGVQTTDITIETGKDIWIVVTDAENYEVSYEEPANTNEVQNDTQQDLQEEKSTNPVPYILIAVVAVIVIAVAGTVIYKKKK